jgi:D-2-hydroxyglutarate dehydrogenase
MNLMFKAVWNIREGIAAAGLMGTYLFAYDVSLPQKNYYEIVPKLRERLGDKVQMVGGFGHIGRYNQIRNINHLDHDHARLQSDQLKRPS